MKDKARLLAAASVAAALLGAAGTLAPVVSKLVIPEALWVVSPYLALAVMAFFSRRRVAAASLTLLGTVAIATVAIAVVGSFALLVAGSRTWVAHFVPFFLWGGWLALLLAHLARWLFFPDDRG
jgi:hypothetical protein